MEGFKDNYYILNGYPTTICKDNKHSIDGAVKAEKVIFNMLQNLANEEHVQIENVAGQDNDAADFFSRIESPVKEILAFNIEKYKRYFEKILKEQLYQTIYAIFHRYGQNNCSSPFRGIFEKPTKNLFLKNISHINIINTIIESKSKSLGDQYLDNTSIHKVEFALRSK